MSVLQYKMATPDLELPYSHANRSYATVEFPSKLRCLLISDPSSRAMAASVAVGAGSFDDPDNIPGLAHLCEHALALGTKRCPYGLPRAVEMAGGTFNAFTSGEQTNFAFEISAFAKTCSDASLDSVFATFGSFFKSPKVCEAFLESEIEAIHDEHNINTSCPSKVLFHGLRLLANPLHPFSRFATGSRSTLSRIGTKKMKELVNTHYRRRFSADRMSLVIKGPQSLNQLRKLAVCHFGDVKDSPDDSTHSYTADCRPDNSVSGDESPFTETEFNSILIQDDSTPTLRMCFPFAREEISEPLQRMLCNLIGDESEGSLCEKLKRKLQLARSVLVSTEYISTANGLFIITVELTGTGINRLRNIIELSFHYIHNTLDLLTPATLKRIAKEYRIIEEYSFMTSQPASPIEEVVEYAERLHSKSYDKNFTQFIRGYEDCKEGPLLVEEFRRAKSKLFTSLNLRLQVIANDLQTVLQTFGESSRVSQDQFYKFLYVLGTFKRTPSYLDSKFCELLVPRPIGSPIEWVAQSCLLNLAMTSDLETRQNEIETQDPQLLWFDNCLEVWLQTISNEVPFSHQTITVHSSYLHIPPTADNLVGIELLALILGEKLKYKNYYSELIGCNWALYANLNGEPSISITVSGPSQCTQHMMQSIIPILDNLALDIEIPYVEIKKARNVLRAKYEQYLDAKGVKKVFTHTFIILEEGIISPDVRIEALEMHESASLRILGLKMKETGAFKSILISGEVSEDECRILRVVCTSPTCGIDSQHTSGPASSYIIEEGTKSWISMKAEDDDNISVVLYYIQIGSRSDSRLFALTKVLQYAMENTALNELRTKRKVAYTILTGMKIFRRTFGLHVTVPSSQHSCEYIARQIEDYLCALLDDLSVEKAFQSYVSGFLESLKQSSHDDSNPSGLFACQKPVHGSDLKMTGPQFQKHWNLLDQILASTYNFGGEQCEEPIKTGIIEDLSHRELMTFAHRYLSPTKGTASVLIIADQASSELSDKKLQIISDRFQKILLSALLFVPIEKLKELLLACNDKLLFSDLDKHLLRYFSSPDQKVKFKFLCLKMKLGRMRGQGSGSQELPLRSANSKPNVATCEQIQKESRLAASIPLYKKLEMLSEMNYDDDIMDHYIGCCN